MFLGGLLVDAAKEILKKEYKISLYEYQTKMPLLKKYYLKIDISSDKQHDKNCLI